MKSAKTNEPKKPSDEIGQEIPQEWFTREHHAFVRKDNDAVVERVESLQALQQDSQRRLAEDTGSYAIIGGGITGLAAAHYLTRDRPRAKVTIFEGGERLGGWMSSRRVQVEGGEILFEQGPRTLRANTWGSGATILELVCGIEYFVERHRLMGVSQIQELDLKDHLVLTPKDSEAARNRYVYYPDHLVKMPGPGQGFLEIAYNVLAEPALRWTPIATLKEYFVPRRPDSLEDESIASFLERRLGTKDAADNLVSAVLHGIYAGDINQLSVKSLMPRVWNFEGGGGSITKGLADSYQKGLKTRGEYRDLQLTNSILQKPGFDNELLAMIQNSSVFSFKDGIVSLTAALELSLQKNPNVQIKTGVNVKSIQYNRDTKKVNVSIPSPSSPSHIY